jgi:hypothetical protein
MTSDSKINKIHQKVSHVLGMAMVEPEETDEDLVPVPESTEICLIDNPDLPDMTDEMSRLEHAQRQTDFLLDQALPVVEHCLAKSLTMPPIYLGRAIEANAKLLEAVGKLAELKIQSSMKLMELKMKQASFSRNKDAGTPTITNSNVFFNREELMRTRENFLKEYIHTDDAD